MTTTGLPLEKIALIQSLAATLKESSQPVTLRSLSRFIGMCTATRPAVFQAPAHYHHLQFLKNSVLQNSSELNWVYNRKVSLNQAAKEDLVWWINHLSQNSTQPIILPSPNKIITTDSSDFGWGIWSRGDHSQGLWSGEETRWHLNLKELMAGFIGLKLYAKGQPYLTHISLQMDNMTACHYINHLGGTGSVNLCMLTLKMWKWCRQRNIHISGVYIPGQLNFIADILSRLINLNSEWKLNPAIFRQICVIYNTLDLDLFATRANNQVQKFISWFPDPDALATNAFSIPWSNQPCYAFPPYSQIMKCLKKFSLTKPRFSSLLLCGGRDRGFQFYKPFRRNRFCQSLHAHSQNVEVVPTKKYPHFSCLHRRSTQLHSRHSVPINKSQFRMETPLQLYLEDFW